MKRTILITALCLSMIGLSACGARPNQARDVLEGAGYTEIDLRGYTLFGCSDDDRFRTAFEATGPNGQRVAGTVCSGFFKGATIRVQRQVNR